MSTYLEELTIRLAAGIGRLPESCRDKHAAYLKAAQCPDGGFAGRQGDSDVYYTGFALRALAILGELYGDIAERAAEFLKLRLSGRESIVDFFSLIYGAAILDAAAGIDVYEKVESDWRAAVRDAMEQLRREAAMRKARKATRAALTTRFWSCCVCS